MTLAPRLVVTAGLHGSASTAVFNIVRELMAAAVGAERLIATYSEDLLALPEPLGRETRHVVLKSHYGGPAWRWLVALTEAPVILSIRDPRDAVVSMIERFRLDRDTAVLWLEKDCDLAMRLADAGPMLLRYEDGYFADPALAATLARHLGLDVGDEMCRDIGQRYSTQGVRAFAQSLDGLPPGRVVKGGWMHFDPVTQIHATHVGDGQVGKWRDRLSPDHGAAMTQLFAPFLARFGYEV